MWDRGSDLTSPQHSGGAAAVQEQDTAIKRLSRPLTRGQFPRVLDLKKTEIPEISCAQVDFATTGSLEGEGCPSFLSLCATARLFLIIQSNLAHPNLVGMSK